MSKVSVHLMLKIEDFQNIGTYYDSPNMSKLDHIRRNLQIPALFLLFFRSTNVSNYKKRNGIEKNGMTIFWGTENEKTEIRQA